MRASTLRSSPVDIGCQDEGMSPGGIKPDADHGREVSRSVSPDVFSLAPYWWDGAAARSVIAALLISSALGLHDLGPFTRIHRSASRL